jgi:hypothetical protein
LVFAGFFNFVSYLLLLVVVFLSGAGAGTGLLWLWAAFSLGYMAARALTLGLRARTDRWMVLGAR